MLMPTPVGLAILRVDELIEHLRCVALMANLDLEKNAIAAVRYPLFGRNADSEIKARRERQRDVAPHQNVFAWRMGRMLKEHGAGFSSQRERCGGDHPGRFD